MSKHRKISIEEILTDTDPDRYRVDGFRLLAKMIARRHMIEGVPDQMSMNSDVSRLEDLNGVMPEIEDD